MNCYIHTATPAVAFCRTCGRALCAACQRPAEGTIFCAEHAPINPYTAPPPSAGAQPAYTPPAAVHTSPALAFIFGWIPGVGAIYNGQYIKGLVHAIIFGLLISLISSAGNSAGVPLLSMLLVGFIFYMPFEAYHTARKRQLGLPVEEWSSFAAQRSYSGRAPVGAILLIAIGVLFLLDSLHLIDFREIGRFWPVLLIVWGAFMLYSRVSGPASPHLPKEAPERQHTPKSSSFRVWRRYGR